MSSIDAITTAILTHCLGAPARLKPLLASVPRATLYRRVDELVREGLLDKVGDRYRTTLAGERAVRAPEPEAAPDDDVEKAVLAAFSAFSYLPTPVHRAAELLVIGSVTARQHLHQNDSLPGFAFLGPPMTWKTKTAEFGMALVGAPPENLVYSPAEGGRSLFIRKDTCGRIQTIRKILEGPLVAFDEYHRAASAVKALIGAFLHGKREIPFENTTLKLHPTPIILLNPVKPAGSIFDRLGVDEAQFRRLVVFDFDGVEISAGIEDKGTEYLKEIRKQSPIELKAPTGLTDRSRERIKTAIKLVVLRKEHLRYIDFSMVISIIEGLTGYLGEEMAVRAGTLAYVRSLATIGFAAPGWSRIVSDALNPTVSVAPAAPVVTGTVPPTATPLDYQGNLSRLHTALRALQGSPQDLQEVLDDMSALALLLRDIGIPPKLFFQWMRETRRNSENLAWLREMIARFRQGMILLVRGQTEDNRFWVEGGSVTGDSCKCQQWGSWMYDWDCMQGLKNPAPPPQEKSHG